MCLLCNKVLHILRDWEANHHAYELQKDLYWYIFLDLIKL